MAGMARKRFWKTAQAVEAPGGHSVQLDARALRTPAKAPLVVGSRALAEAVAAEWQAQGDHISPETMPLTRAVNAAIDKVTPLREGVIGEIAGYGGTDLLCYRSEAPQELRARQEAAWDPLLAWAATRYGISFATTTGVMPCAQGPATLAALTEAVADLDAYELTALHDLVAISGSLVIGLAVLEGHASAEALWPIARIDEQWQVEHWGEDEEASAEAALKQAAFAQAERLLQLHRAG